MKRLRTYLRLRSINAALAVLVLIAAGVVFGPIALGGPRVLQVTPPDRAADANPQAGIQIMFSQWVWPDSVRDAVSFDPPVEFAVTAPRFPRAGAALVVLQPTGGLRYGAHYRMTVGAGARNLFGRAVEQPVAVAFTTAPYVAVARFGPESGATDVPLRAPITIEFGAPVVPADQIAAAAQDPRLADGLPQPISLAPAAQGVGRWLSPTRFGFYPAADLRAATPYTVTVREEVSPDGRWRLEKPLAWSFTTAAPLLAGARPYDGATEAPPSGEVEVRLHPDVDIASAGASFSLRESGSGTPVPGAVQPSQDGFLFKPAALLRRGGRYEASLAPGVRSGTGVPLNSRPLSWSFTVIGDLEVAQVEPPPDTTEVLTSTKRISVRFNHPVVALTTIDAATRLPAPFTIAPALAGEGRWLDTSTYVFTPQRGLLPSTGYRVRVAAGLSDQTGGALRQEYAWTFSTIVPRVFGTVPAVDARYASPRDPIRVIFNQPMDLASLRGALRLRRDGADIPGAVGFGGIVSDAATIVGGPSEPGRVIPGWVATFTPVAPLERGAGYTLAVDAGARSSQGSGVLASAFSATFQVAPPPRLQSSEPANGAGAVDPGANIRLAFSAPMDWATVERNLTITPRPAQVYTSTSETELFLYFPLKPETDYRVAVGGSARDAFGVPLGQDVVVAFRTGSPAPSLALVGGYRVGAYNAYVPARVPIQHLGTPSVTYRLFRIDPTQIMALVVDYDTWNTFSPTASSLLKQGDLSLTGDRNQQRIDLLDLGRLEAGAYMVEVSGPGTLLDRQIMAVSPYALTLKRSDGQLFLWAADLATGKPAADLPLTAATYSYERRDLSQVVALGRTDAQGVLNHRGAVGGMTDPLFVWSPGETTFAFGASTWGEGISPWDFGVPADYAHSPLIGSVSTDRPIYRPEQNVYIRGALRLDRNVTQLERPAREQRAFLTIGDPEGSAVFSGTLPLTEFGTFATSFALDRSAKLGVYSISGRLLDGDQAIDAAGQNGTFSGTFSVAEYRKPAFEVTVAPARPDLVQGDTLDARVTARYFSGGAVANAPVRWRLLANPFYFAPDAAPGYTFENLDDASAWYRWDQSQRPPGGEQVADGQAKTDAQGGFSVHLPATLGQDGHSRTLTLDVEVTDVDGQVIAAQGAATVHAGAFYIGLRPEGYVVQAGQAQKVSIVTLDPQGRPVANRALTLGLYKREWNSVRQQGADGRLYWTSSYSDTLVATQAATTDAQGRALAGFTPREGGQYRIGAEGKDDGGHVVQSSAYSWVYGGEVFWGVNDTNRVDLIADKAGYRPGDTANILVTAPYKDMRALMTIERGAVIDYKLFTLQGTTELLHVPIGDDYAPNVYVSVVLLKPAGGDVPVPDLRVGLVNLPISTERQELNIQIAPDIGAGRVPAQAGPRDQVTYTVKATDYTGKGVRAEVGLALVDKAVLSLADDPNPSFKEAFYTRRPLGVFSAQTLTVLVERVTLKLQAGDKGGGGGLASEALIRRNFPDTAYWNPAVVTGDDGAASVTLTLPDSLTTWRMTARAITGDTRVGQASSDLIASRPLLVRPALPRFLTVGDRLSLQAVLHNNTATPIDATVTLDQAAPEAQAAGHVALKLNADAKRTIQVPANGTAVVRWPAEAPDAGQALLRFTVEGGGQRDAVEQALPVQRFMTPEVVASAGQVLDRVVETIAAPPTQGGGSAAGELRLELTPSLAAGIGAQLDFLEHYPYLCTEQTVSRFLPNAVTYRLFKQLGVTDQKLKDSLDRNLIAGVQRLYALQRLDGGWGWWEEGDSQPYLTAYVVQGFVEARRAGYAVDQDRFDRAMAYLRSFLDAGETQTGDSAARLQPQGSSRNARSYVLFVLAEAGQPDRGRTVALFEQREKLDIYARAYLLMTLKTLGGEDDRARTLVGELMGSAILHAADAHWEERTVDYWNMSSDERTTALALQALIRVDPTNFLIPNAVRYLIGRPSAEALAKTRLYPRTTQESATALMALAEYLAQSGELEADYSFRAALEGKTLKEGAINRDNLNTPIDVVVALADLKLGGTSQLTIQRQAAAGQTGKGKLYYTLRMRSYQDAAQVRALDQGIGVRREYIAVDTDTLSPTGQLIAGARLGDVVQVRLALTVPEDVRYLAVEDLLPAGLEPIDTSLKTASAAARGAAPGPAGDDQPSWWYVDRTEIHDNRVALFATHLPRGTYSYTYLARATTAGTFTTLPATAYQMYAPEVFGRGDGATFIVAAP